MAKPLRNIKKCTKCNKAPCVCSMTEGTERVDESAKSIKSLDNGDTVIHSDFPKYEEHLKKKGYSGPHSLLSGDGNTRIMGKHYFKPNPEAGTIHHIRVDGEHDSAGMTKTNPTGVRWKIKHVGMMAGRTAHDMMNQLKKLNKEEVESVDEKLTKDMSAGDVISDFVHSKDPKFAGKSKKERQRMALGAYYSMQKEEKDEEDDGWYAHKEIHGKDAISKEDWKKGIRPKKSVKEEVEGDYEYDMARNELATAERAIQRLMEILGQDEGNLEAWVQSKITKACDYLDTVADYMESQQKTGG